MFNFDWLTERKTPPLNFEENSVPTCTYCGGTEFYEGPSGGMATNILCANPECRHWFNHIMGRLDDLNSQEPSDEEKAQEREDRKDTINLGDPRMLVKKDVIYQEGCTLFKNGEKAIDCLQESKRVGVFAAYSDILRLSGYIDAQNEFYKNKLL